MEDEARQGHHARILDSQGNVQYSNNPGQIKYGGDTISMALLKAAERIHSALVAQVLPTGSEVERC